MASNSGKAAVLGQPIGHSLSPVLHGYWLRHYQLNGVYEAIETEPGQLAQRLEYLQQQAYQGINLTLPLKEKVIPLLDEVDPLALRIGAVNTVVFQKNGRKKGYNTDSYGFLENLRVAGVNPSAYQKVVVLGAGGAAKAIVAGLLDVAGARNILLCNRNRERAQALVQELQASSRIRLKEWEEREKALEGASLLVNTTSLGMKNQPALDISLHHLPPHAWVSDIVYTPLQTQLLVQARQRGNSVVDGLGMLLYQGQLAFEHFFGIKPEVTENMRLEILTHAKN